VYVAIEGVDTCGKSTQIELLKREFREATFLKEPGFTELGKKIRDLVLFENMSERARLFLFLADRAELYERVFRESPASMYISDRSAISGMAYAEGFDTELLLGLNSIALNGFFPQKCVVLELSQKELEKRLSEKSVDLIESKGVDYLLSIQQRIVDSAKTIGCELELIDASLSKEEILVRIKKFILL